MLRKVAQIVGLLIACVGIGLFVALGFTVWSLKAEVNRQTESLATKAHRAGDEADQALEFVRTVIAQAKKDLDTARPQAAVKPSRPASFFDIAMAQAASQRLAGSVDQAQNAVATASDAVVVADTALRLFSQSENLQQLLGVQPSASQLEATDTTLTRASAELRRARSALGGTPTPEQLTAVDNALGQADDFTDELAKVVMNVRDRVNSTRSSVDSWSWRIAVGTTILSVLAVAGQFFMARYFWRTLRGLPA